MEVRQLRIAALPVLIALFGFFALSVAASSGLSGARLWNSASKNLINPGLSIQFSDHGLVNQISTKQQPPVNPMPIVSQGKNVVSGLKSTLLTQQLDASASAVR